VDNYLDTIVDESLFTKPIDYPSPSLRIMLKEITINFRLIKGIDFHDKGNLTNVNNNNQNTRLDNSYIILKLINFSLQYDTFNSVTNKSNALNSSLLWRLDLSINDVEIEDHLPESNWNKFMCYNLAVLRYQSSPMFKISFEQLRANQNTSPGINNLARLKVHVLPLLFHIDQDAFELLFSFVMEVYNHNISTDEKPETTSKEPMGKQDDFMFETVELNAS